MRWEEEVKRGREARVRGAEEKQKRGVREVRTKSAGAGAGRGRGAE